MGRTGGAPWRADGELVRFAGGEMPVARATPGDLVFVRAEDTPLGALIGELDGCAYSHVGVLADDPEPTLLSARTDRHGTVESPDLGGVRRNRLADLADREPFVAPLALPKAVRRAGLEKVEGWVEEDAGPDRVSRSRFSYVKLVVAATALAAVRRREPLAPHRAERLWQAAVAAADAFHWEGPFPGFYCAEVVAAAYGLEFSVGAFCVPDGEPNPAGIPAPAPHDPATPAEVDRRDRIPSFGEAVREADGVLRALTEIDLTVRQARTAVRLAAAVVRYDRPLAGRLQEAARELSAGAAAPPGGHHPRPVPADPFRPPAFLDPAAALPTALVTPRMLLSSRVVRSVHRLVL